MPYKREWTRKKSPMVNITINIPIPYLMTIDKLIEAKRVASRSEAIRAAIFNFLRDDISFLNKMINKVL